MEEVTFEARVAGAWSLRRLLTDLRYFWGCWSHSGSGILRSYPTRMGDVRLPQVSMEL